MQNFCALVKSSAESWTPPAARTEEDGHQNEPLAPRLRSHGGKKVGHRRDTSNICSPDLPQQHLYVQNHSKPPLACSCQQVCKHGVIVCGVLHPASSPEGVQHLLRWTRVKPSGVIYIPLFSTRSSICPSGHYRPDIQLKHFLEEAKDVSLPVFYPGAFFGSNETLMKHSALVPHLPRSTRTSPPHRTCLVPQRQK